MKKQIFSLFMAIGLISVLAVSCNQEALDITPNTYSGKEYFKSIFLLQGELTDQIPSLKHFAKYMAVESEEAMTTIINRINESDPSFLADLETALTSKNASDIEMVMDRGNALLKIGMLPSSRFSTEVEEQLVNLNTSGYDLTNEADVQKFVSTIHSIVNSNSKTSKGTEIGTEKCVIVPYAYVAVYAYYWFWGPGQNRDVAPTDSINSDQFLKEKLVSELINLN